MVQLWRGGPGHQHAHSSEHVGFVIVSLARPVGLQVHLAAAIVDDWPDSQFEGHHDAHRIHRELCSDPSSELPGRLWPPW
eukprot:1219898-Pyramimonas_sp.AAC.1